METDGTTTFNVTLTFPGNITTTAKPHHDHAHLLPTPILFIFGCCAIGALSRTFLKLIPQIPYTIVLLICGFMMGLLARKVEIVDVYTGITAMAGLDPHLILHAFLPVLIFESAYAMEAHTFLKSFLQIMLLAVPGLGIASILTAGFCKNVYGYNWGWNLSMMFGCLISATDPVAVVALLKELGASKQLAILLEGESLLNDGAAIVLFSIFNTLATPDLDLTGLDIFVEFVQKAIVGPLFGFLMSKLTILWLVNIFNDALTEITITLASTYVTFYIGEGILKSSGVLAVVVLGVVISSNRTSISPEVETFLHRFWEMLAYLANTLIFFLVGVVIAVKAAANATLKDVVLILSLYCAITVIRFVVILGFSPLLKRTGYGMTWRNSAVMVWGGLRGAVGLALALIVVQNEELDETGVTQNIILLHTAGIVLLTLLINGTSIQPLLNILGMSEVSIPKRMAMASAVRALNDVVHTSVSLYKTDRFLADADWDHVSKFITVEDPYKTLDEEAELDQLTLLQRKSKCPKCTTEVLNEPSPLEMKEMRHEARLRLLKAEKITYWKQFEHGMLSREAVRKLNDLIDHAADTEDLMVDTSDISKTWKMKGIWDYIKKYLEKFTANKKAKVGETAIPVPLNKFLRVMYKMCNSTVFEVIINIIILANIVSIIYEIVEENTMCQVDFTEKYGNTLKIINYVFIGIYVIEAVVKLLGFRKWYFRSKWNVFDFVILILSLIDIILDITVFSKQVDTTCESETSTSSLLSPSILRIAKAIRLLRLLRSLRLVKVLIPQIIDAIDVIISRKLRFGYDVGKGYVMGEEEVQNFLDLMIDNEKIAGEFRDRLTDSRMEITRELGLLQKKHPGVAVSIKTQQAARRILNNIQEKILEMKGEGVIDDKESERLITMVEVHIKHLMKIAPSIPPPPAEKIIGNLSWVQGDEVLINYIKHNAVLVSLTDGEQLLVESDPKGGVYVIISGLVKVDKFVEGDKGGANIIKAITTENNDRLSTADLTKISDFMSTGSVLGELALLTGKPSNIMITCETSTQLYHISYEAIQAALELFTEEPSLEYRLWRVCAIRVATTILKHLPQYMAWSPEKLKVQMEKCFLCIEQAEMPEGGKVLEYQVFDISSFEELCDTVLILGVAENYDIGTVYEGPCYIPARVQKLILIPGKTEKHVLFLLPRDSAGADNTGMLSEVMDHARSSHHTSNTHILSDNLKHLPSTVLSRISNSTLCLGHAAKERDVLNKRISIIRMNSKSKSSLTGLIRKMSSHRPPNDSEDLEMAKVTNYIEPEDFKPGAKERKKAWKSIPKSRSKSDVQMHVAEKEDDGLIKSSSDKETTVKTTGFPPISTKPSPLITGLGSSTKADRQPKTVNKPPVSNSKPQPPLKTKTAPAVGSNKVSPMKKPSDELKAGPGIATRAAVLNNNSNSSASSKSITKKSDDVKTDNAKPSLKFPEVKPPSSSTTKTETGTTESSQLTGNPQSVKQNNVTSGTKKDVQSTIVASQVPKVNDTETLVLNNAKNAAKSSQVQPSNVNQKTNVAPLSNRSKTDAVKQPPQDVSSRSGLYTVLGSRPNSGEQTSKSPGLIPVEHPDMDLFSD